MILGVFYGSLTSFSYSLEPLDLKGFRASSLYLYEKVPSHIVKSWKSVLPMKGPLPPSEFELHF